MRLSYPSQLLLEYMKKYAHSEWYVINETSTDFSRSAYDLLTDIESDYDCDMFEDVITNKIMTTEEFRKYVFPERLLINYYEYLESL